MLASLKTGKSFSINDYDLFAEVPLHQLDEVAYSAYIINYNWVYLFINKSARDAFGPLADKLIGNSALETFRDSKFAEIFENIKDDVERKLAINKTVVSPLRGSQVILKGHALKDCYYFSATVVPTKVEVLNELRDQLNKRKSSVKSVTEE